MATHDYVIDNQTAPNFRSDLNNALAAIVSQNSNATAPTTTFANMLWYDTANNQIKKRNEADSAWIILGTVDETNSKFEPNFTPATQVEAEAGTNNTKVMTPLRVAQAISNSLVSVPVGWVNHDGSNTISPIYNSAVNGAVATIVSPDFVDGYEYQFIFAGLNNSAGTTFELQLELYRETTAAYATASTILTDQATVTKGELTIFHPRMVMNAHRIEGKLADVSNTNSASVVSWPDTIDGYIGHATAQKLLRARFSMNSGNINAGKLYMLRRADKGVLA